METQLNLDSLTVGKNGRLSFSGLSSGIDIQGTVESIIHAKRIPIDTIEQRMSSKQAEIAALRDLRGLAIQLREAVAGLRGAVTYDAARDAFAAKRVFASSSRTDSQTPSSASDLVGVTVINAARATTHQVEIQQIAKAHKVASASQSGTTSDALSLSGTFTINGSSISLASSDSLLDLRDKINAANSGESPPGAAASLVSLSTSSHVLVLSADDTGASSTMSLADSSGTVLEDLGVLDGSGAVQNELQAAQNALLEVDSLGSTVSRESNIIDDLFGGVTLSLFKAEPGTTLDVSVERDLGEVKSAIASFVEAYNAIRVELNAQAQGGPRDEEAGAGVLAGTSALSEMRARLAAAVGSAVESDASTLSVLAEIGITFRGRDDVADPLEANTLTIDEGSLDEALLNQTDAVRDLFTFGLTSSNSDVRLAGFDGGTGYIPGGYTLNIAATGGTITSANLGGPADGSDDGSVAVQGDVLTVTGGSAEGLKLLYTGDDGASGINLDVSVGVGAQIFHAVDALADDTTGLLASEMGSREWQVDFNQERVARMEERLERERERLLERFVAMEAAISSMNRLMDTLRQQIDATFGNQT